MQHRMRLFTIMLGWLLPLAQSQLAHLRHASSGRFTTKVCRLEPLAAEFGGQQNQMSKQKYRTHKFDG